MCESRQPHSDNARMRSNQVSTEYSINKYPSAGVPNIAGLYLLDSLRIKGNNK